MIKFLKTLLAVSVLGLFGFTAQYIVDKNSVRELKTQLETERSMRRTAQFELASSNLQIKVLKAEIEDISTTLEDISLVSPLANMQITSAFGMRRNRITDKLSMHKGLDLRANVGTPIIAPSSGQLTVGYDTRSGNIARLISPNGRIVHKFFHLNKPAITNYYSQGDTIGYTGNTGRSYAPHLHWEVLIDNRHINPFQLLDVFSKAARIRDEKFFTNETKFTGNFDSSTLIADSLVYISG